MVITIVNFFTKEKIAINTKLYCKNYFNDLQQYYYGLLFVLNGYYYSYIYIYVVINTITCYYCYKY